MEVLASGTSGSHLDQRERDSWEWDGASAEYAGEEVGGHACVCTFVCMCFNACLIIAAMLICAALRAFVYCLLCGCFYSPLFPSKSHAEVSSVVKHLHLSSAEQYSTVSMQLQVKGQGGSMWLSTSACPWLTPDL